MSALKTPKLTKDNCVCNWGEDCRQLMSRLAKHDPDYAGLVRIRTGSDQAKALRFSIQWHLKLSPRNAKKKEYFVARHHWERALIARNFGLDSPNNSTKKFTTPTTRIEAELLGCDKALFQDCNSMLFCLRGARGGGEDTVSDQEKTKFKNMFVQAPFNPKSAVQDYLATFSSGRAA